MPINIDSPSTPIYLFLSKWRGAIHASSMRYFQTLQDLEAHVRTQTPEYWSGAEPWHAYRVYCDGAEVKILSTKECRAIGLRP
jgi:hypothetical protein